MIHDFMGQKYHDKINVSIVLKMRVKKHGRDGRRVAEVAANILLHN